MRKVNLKRGARYKASFKLGFFEANVGNPDIAKELAKIGFADIRIWGSKYIRYAEARYDGDNRVADLPRQVHEIIELPVVAPKPANVPGPKPKMVKPKPRWWRFW